MKRVAYYADLDSSRREAVHDVEQYGTPKAKGDKLWLVLWGTREGNFEITEVHAPDEAGARHHAMKTFPEIHGIGDVMPGGRLGKERFFGERGSRTVGVLE